MKKMDYLDLFALPLPKRNLSKYRRTAQQFAGILKRYGALDYREFMGDDLHPKGMTPFTKDIKLRNGEVLIGAYILYRSRSHRAQVNKRVMSDPRVKKMIEEMNARPVHDPKRMLYGGFRTIVRM